MASGSSDEDEDYDAFGEMVYQEVRKYPIHDACEFDDVETLRRLILEPVEESDDEDEEDDDDNNRTSEKQQPKAHEESSSDENDSTEAAHAAAIGHSPQPIRPTIERTDAVIEPPILEQNKEEDSNGKVANEEGLKKQEETPSAADKIEKESEKEAQNDEAIGGTDAPEGNKEKTTPMDIDNEEATKPSPAGEETQKSNGTEPDAIQKEPARQKEIKHKVPFGVHLNERDNDENTALHVAIHARRLEHVKLLLEAGASFRMKCDGSWPMHTAISLGALKQHRQFAYECVVVLREYGADLTAKDDSSHTPLFLACMVNLPQIVSYILSDDEGLSTLNTRADRVGNRPLHAAAKYDTLASASFGRTAAASVTGQERTHHHPDMSVVNSMHHIPGFPGKLEASARNSAAQSTPSTEALLTQVLLGTTGIEVDGPNAIGQTALHIACLRGNWPVARLLLQAGASPTHADRRGFTPGQLAHKRGMPIPNDLQDTLGDPPESGIIPPPRDLIVDPDGSTLVLTHELCVLHRTCPPMRRDANEPPPENVRRLHVLIDEDTGILKSGEFGNIVWRNEARRAAMCDILKVHEYRYVETISQLASSIPDIPQAISHLDPDTAISRWSFEAALRAAGSICQAVDQVVAGECRNAFCAVRPPGHHAGPRGIVRCANDPEGGSHGFCLLNNVAIGAAYARSMYRNDGISKIAIVDFDVHHGNGTEEIIRQLVPITEKATIRTPFAYGEMTASSYRPWLDETDIQNVFFSSTHGYGNRGFEQPGWFYPASGKTHTSEAITHPAMVENPNLTDFILSQTWARMGEDSRSNCCKIINVGLGLPSEEGSDAQGRSMKQRLELRDTYRHKVLPHLREFDPDLIFISAGFDAHRKDTMNFGYIGMVEDDYEWVTEQLVKVANTCCNGRIISVLEGGYKIHGGIVSPFARSVASHVRAMVDGGRSRELYDSKDVEWESQHERHIYERRERKREEERERLRLMEEARRNMLQEQMAEEGENPEDPDAPSRKRRRNHVDYKELFKQMQQEGFGN